MSDKSRKRCSGGGGALPGLRLRAPLAMALAAVLACADEPTEPPPPPPPVPTTITISPESVEFTSLGETSRLTAEVKDQHGNVMSIAVTWSTSAPATATVNSAGVVTAVANGPATITATAQSASGTAQATIAQRVAAVSVLPEAFKLIPGGSVRGSASAADARGNPMAGVIFSWTSSDTTVATVDQSGFINAREVGAASVASASGDIASALEVTVVVPPRVRSLEIVSVPTNGGILSGGGTWELPTTEVFAAGVSAGANPGYDFDRWVEGDVTLSADSLYEMQLAGEHSVAARFSVNPERGRWGPGNTYSDYEFPGTGYESLAWTFLPVVDPPRSLADKGLLHYYAYNFRLLNTNSSTGFGYAGFQSDGHLGGNRWGKVVNFSIWGSNAARTDGLLNPNNTECGCHQIMLRYEWVEGRKYRYELREGPSGVESEGKWWGLWVTDLASDSTSFVGEQRVPVTIGGRPSTLWSPHTSVFGEDLYWWRSRDGSEKFICSDFEASSLAVLDVTAGANEDRPVRTWTSTNSGNLDVAENGYETTLCYVTLFQNGHDVQHNVGFWPEPPDNALLESDPRIRR